MTPLPRHAHWLGKDERGIGQYRALVCGHPVHHPDTKTCRDCPHLRTRRPKRKAEGSRYVRHVNGQSVYLAECGHEVRGNRAKRCRPCRAKATTSYPKTMRDGKIVSVHTQIAERVLGRKLKPNEMVHHINLNKRDFRNCNLLICTREYHQALHHAMERAYGELCCPSLPS